jgi:hypothetical protein
MSVFDNYTREQLRLTYAQAWSKHLARSPLTPLEALVADVIALHPEYHGIVGDTDAALAFEQSAAGGSENPFLHMGLHLAVREQVSIDRPPGIRDLQHQLQRRYGAAHLAEHVLMEALAEELYRAQSAGQAPDEKRYLARVRDRLTAR